MAQEPAFYNLVRYGNSRQAIGIDLTETLGKAHQNWLPTNYTCLPTWQFG
jgi:hypothetical protein